jgi:aspartyl-tRNA synthetase
MAFPKTATGGDPMSGAPAPVDAPQLKELGLSTTAPRPSSGEPGPGAR